MSEQTRVPAGVRTGGQFTTGARGESAADLTGPVTASAHRTDADTWQHPADVDRAHAITAYDDEARWAMIGEHLHVSTPRWADRYWVDTARPVLAQLHAAGLHGQARANINPDSEGRVSALDEFDLEVDLPSGRALRLHASTGRGRRWVGASWPDNWTRGSVSADADHCDIDQDRLDALIDDAVSAHDALAAYADAAVAAGIGRASHSITIVDSQTPGEVRARIWASGPGGADTTVALRDGKAHIVAVQGVGTVEHDERQLLDLARRLGLRGGKRGRAGDRAQELLDAAAHAAQDGPDLTAVRAHRARLRG